MKRSQNLCPRFQYAVGLLSKRWTGLIVKVLLDGPMRYNELAEKLDIVADRVLVERLRELETEGIVVREVYTGSPVRVVYGLTPKGTALSPLIAEIESWAHAWLPEDLATTTASTWEETIRPADAVVDTHLS